VAKPHSAVGLDTGLARRFYLAAALNGLAFGLEVSALPIYFLGLGLAPPIYGLLIGLAWLVSLGVRLPIGMLALRFGNRLLLAVGCWAYAPLSWALLASGNVPFLFAVRLLNGGARSLIVLPLRSWFSELCPRHEMAAQFGRLSASYAIGQSLLGLLLGPLILTALGPGALLGLLGLVPLVLWWLVRPVPPDHPADSAQAAAGRGEPRLLWVAALCSVSAAAMVSGYAAFLPAVVLDLGWPATTVGLLLLVQGVGTVIIARYNGFLVRRWGEEWPTLVGLGCAGATAVVLYTSQGGAALVVVSALGGAASGVLPTIAMGLAARALPSRSQGIAVNETFTSVGLGAGGLLGGLATAWLGTPRAALLACVPLTLCAMAAVLLVQRHRAP
jgi:MFS family permease